MVGNCNITNKQQAFYFCLSDNGFYFFLTAFLQQLLCFQLLFSLCILKTYPYVNLTVLFFKQYVNTHRANGSLYWLCYRIISGFPSVVLQSDKSKNLQYDSTLKPKINTYLRSTIIRTKHMFYKIKDNFITCSDFE